MALPESRQLDFDEIPVIDISPLIDNEESTGVVDQIDRACRDIGFFYIIGHGFDMNLALRLQQAADEYFSQPESNKLALGLDRSMRGFLPLFYRSQISDTFSGTSHQEGFWIGADFMDDVRHPLEQSNRWPEYPTSLKPAMTEYLTAIENNAYSSM